jgi:GntR family transcriptional repressor for pyruvate dehydrogenase complex
MATKSSTSRSKRQSATVGALPKSAKKSPPAASRRSVVRSGLSGGPPADVAGRPHRAFEDIATQIRNELSNGGLKAGDRLPSERELAARFGVSRNTVREALRSLENAGLLQTHKGASGGAFIREGGGDAVVSSLHDLFHLGAIKPQQLTEARLWIDGVVVRAACAKATPADIAELEANITESDKANKRGDFLGRNLINLDFHRILARIAGNPILVIFMDAFTQIMREFIKSVGPSSLNMTPMRRRFMQHMMERDPDAAAHEMELHLKRIHRGYLERFEALNAGEKSALQRERRARDTSV